MAAIRQTRTGKWELSERSKLLPKPFYTTFDKREEAEAYKAQLEALLARGIVPIELLGEPTPKRSDPLLVQVLREYLKHGHPAASDEALIGVLLDETAGVRLGEVTAKWAQAYAHRLKVEQHLAPGTVRKRIGALARALDWFLARDLAPGEGPAAVNPLRLLPRGYSVATKDEADELARRRKEVRHDVARDRRITVDEEARILAALRGEKREDRERPLKAAQTRDLEVLYRLIVDTGLRLREAYTLQVQQLDFHHRTINVRGTNKRGGPAKLRQVPMTRAVRAMMSDYTTGRVGRIFPWWDGKPDGLAAATNTLSQAFRRVFEYAGVADLTEHDLRHEATCRWVELKDADGRWVFSETEICRIMGWSDPRMMLRYASLRGSDLAARLA